MPGSSNFLGAMGDYPPYPHNPESGNPLAQVTFDENAIQQNVPVGATGLGDQGACVAGSPIEDVWPLPLMLGADRVEGAPFGVIERPA